MDPHSPTRHELRDRGFTIVEFVVIAILGIISMAVVFSEGGSTDCSDAVACSADSRTLAQSGDAYLTRT